MEIPNRTVIEFEHNGQPYEVDGRNFEGHYTFELFTAPPDGRGVSIVEFEVPDAHYATEQKVIDCAIAALPEVIVSESQ